MARRKVKVFFDGGCRPNPGRMEAAVVIRGVEYIFDDLGLGTSRDAEWLALIRALELSHSLGLNDVELVGDALTVIRQANSALADRHAVQFHAPLSWHWQLRRTQREFVGSNVSKIWQV